MNKYGVLFLSVITLSCSFKKNETYGNPATTFTMRLIGEPETLDWNRAHTPIENYLMINLMEGLVTVDQNLKVAPSLAESWKISADGKTYTFKMRSSAKWSDGVALKAQDFVFSWKRLLSPLTAASYSYLLYDIVNAQKFNRGEEKDFNQVGVHALDDQTLEVKLSHPISYWLFIPSFWVTFPLRKDIVEKYGSSWEMPGHMVTAGPFTLAAHEIDSKIVLKANPFYYGARGNVETVVALVIRDDSTALSLYDSGKIDFMTDISSIDLKRLEGRSDLKAFPYLKTSYLGMVTDKGPLENVHLRRAIAMAIDRSKLGDILHGGQVAAHSFVTPPMMASDSNLGFQFNPEKARAELKAAGIHPDKLPTIDLLISNSDKSLIFAQYVQQELKKNIGLNIGIQPFDNKTYRAQLDLRTFPFFQLSWSADFPDPDNYLSVFLSDSGNNHSHWKNRLFDQEIERARGLKNNQERLKIYRQTQKMLLEDDAVIIPMYYEPQMVLVKERVRSLQLNPINDLFLTTVNLGKP